MDEGKSEYPFPELETLLSESRDAQTVAGLLLLSGSSTFRLWKSAERDLFPVPVRNQGFGGCNTEELLDWWDALVLPWQPSLIAYYCGGNDLEQGVAPQSLVDNFRFYHERTATQLPKTHILYLSVIRSPQKRPLFNELAVATEGIRQYCEQHEQLHFADINPPFMDERGRAIERLFMEDRLHFNKAGYEVLKRTLKPILSSLAYARA